MANVNVGDPRADLDAACRRPHELRGRHDIVVTLGGEDRIEPCVLRLARDRLDLIGTPAHPGNNGQSESFRHWSLLSELCSVEFPARSMRQRICRKSVDVK